MRSHPIVGSFFLLVGLALLLAGATAHSAPAILGRLPLAPEVAVPFVLWQLALWALFLGWFFLRPRRTRHTRSERGIRALARI